MLFWATWCPPCEKFMEVNQQLLEKRGVQWGESVKIVGFSVDDADVDIASHLEDKKWT